MREVRGLFATTAQLKASVDMRNAEVARATEDLNRRQRLATLGRGVGEELQHARDALTSARAAQVAAQQELAATRRSPIARPSQAIRTCWPPRRRCARRTSTSRAPQLPAPVSGYVAKRTVQLGQRVQPGTPLMAVVPLDQVWVDANFKERSSRHAHRPAGRS